MAKKENRCTIQTGNKRPARTSRLMRCPSPRDAAIAQRHQAEPSRSQPP